MKTKRKLLFAGFVIFSCLSAIKIYWLDGIVPFFIEKTIGNTRYSEKYSERKFSRISTGMSMDEVREILGYPLFTKEFDDGTIIWHYSWGGSFRNNIPVENETYSSRSVFFINGVVSEVYHSLYFD